MVSNGVPTLVGRKKLTRRCLKLLFNLVSEIDHRRDLHGLQKVKITT
jgi:hypothetical protein